MRLAAAGHGLRPHAHGSCSRSAWPSDCLLARPSSRRPAAGPMALVALSVSSTARVVLASLRSSRGYAASAASGAMRRAAAAAEGAAGAGEAKEAGRRAAEISWVPDPVTGHYRPTNWAAAVDPADLRAAHLARSYARA